MNIIKFHQISTNHIVNIRFITSKNNSSFIVAQSELEIPSTVIFQAPFHQYNKQ